MTRPIYYRSDPDSGNYKAAYADGQWVDLEPAVFWTLWRGKVTA